MAKTPELTPSMKQYLETKKKVPDALLLFRIGDFYELFYEDARKASSVLGLALTSRDRDRGPDAVPMAGFPHHQLDIQLSRLITAGIKVAVCEQMESAKASNKIIRRELVRIVTPGTVTDSSILDPKSSNFLVAISFPQKVRFASRSAEDVTATAFSGEEHRPSIHPDEQIGLAWVELSTGDFNASVIPYRELLDYLARIHPSEILLPESSSSFFTKPYDDSVMYSMRPDWTFRFQNAWDTLIRQLKVTTLAGFGFDKNADQLAIEAAGSALDYLCETQRSSLEHLDTLVRYRAGEHLEIDQATIQSLEILHTTDGSREGSLLSILDRCMTPMGSRLLAEWVIYPMRKTEDIRARLDAVEELLQQHSLRDTIRDQLRHVHDLARILSRIVQQRATPRELAAVGATLSQFPLFRDSLNLCTSPVLKGLAEQIVPQNDLADEILRALGEEPPLTWRDGGFFLSGYNPQLDEYRTLQHGGKQWLVSYQKQESERTGIPNLRIGFNSVFGYYIEVSRGQSEKVPDHYVRRQTLKNAERYITEELRQYEEKVLGAEEAAKNLEMELFTALLNRTAEIRATIQHSAVALAHLDALASLAQIAADRGYVRPQIVEEPILHIKDGRHPVLEQTEASGTFTPNDADCAPDQSMIHLITGPNMAGKSTYIRQIALLVLMAHAGSFLPVSSAVVGLTDRIFARVGASDQLTRGLSTFMVEMIETARILHGATPKSLVVLDEIGRGTSTYDGISLAWAITESLLERTGCRTFFATHYHELTQLAESHKGIDNLNVAVREWGDEIAFVHKIVAGPADKSYGIHVARLAGVPQAVTKRARRILDGLESSHLDIARQAMGDMLRQVGATSFDGSDAGGSQPATVQFSLFGPEDHPIVDELRSLDVNTLTPMEALTLVHQWKETLHQEESVQRNREKATKTRVRNH